MQPMHPSPYFQVENSAVQSFLRQSGGQNPSKPRNRHGGGLLKIFKLFPMLSSGCKMATLLGKTRKPLLKDNATTFTIFGYRKGRVTLAIQDDPHCLPKFVIELPIHTSIFHKEMASDVVRIALESDTRTHKRQLLEEFVWGVLCNGRKIGFSVRRKEMSEDECYVMGLLRGVSMGAGVLPSLNGKESSVDGELSYIRARFERVVGNKDSEAYYMINPDGAVGAELSIFFVRGR